MHPALAEAFSRLDRSRAALRAAVGSVPDHLRDLSPEPDCWSVAGVLEHLALVDERCITGLAAKIAEARAADGGEEQGSPARLPPAVEAILANRTERRQAPEPVQPRGVAYDAAWARVEAARAAFRVLLSGADGLVLSRVIHEHPRFGVFSVYQWADFLAGHEWRHVEQIREMVARPDPSRTGSTS